MGGTGSEFASAEEASKGNAVRCKEMEVEDIRGVRQLDNATEDVDSDRELGLAVMLPVNALDPTEDALRDRGVNSVEGVASVGMEGADSGEVSFDCLGLNVTCEADNPFKDGGNGGRQDIAIGVDELGTQTDEVKE